MSDKIICGRCDHVCATESDLVRHKLAHAAPGVEVAVAGQWVRAVSFSPLTRGWVQYRMRSGATGLARPTKWRFA